MEELRAEARHVDFNRALASASFTRQTSIHCRFHFMGKIVFATVFLIAVLDFMHNIREFYRGLFEIQLRRGNLLVR